MKTEHKPDFLQIPYILYEDKEIKPLDRDVFAMIYLFTKLRNKKCTASNKKIAEQINSSASSVANAMSKLEKLGYIQRLYRDEKKRIRSEIKILLEYQKVSPTGERVSPTDDTGVSPTGEQKENIIKENSKDIAKETFADSKQIVEIMEIFKTKVNPMLKYGHKTNRKATDDLIRQFGFDEVVKIATASCQHQGKKFCPTITTPYQLKEKLSNLKIYFDKLNGESSDNQINEY